VKALLWSVGTAAVWAWAALALIAGPFYFRYPSIDGAWSTATDWSVLCGVGCALLSLSLVAVTFGSTEARRRVHPEARSAHAETVPAPAPAVNPAPAAERVDRSREIRRLAAFALQQLEQREPEDSHPRRTTP
jgi:hypothetical protein